MPSSDPLDDVAFLARSPHRVQVLQTLAEGSRSRPDIHEVTGIPQPTLGRVLDGFEDRNWVEQEGREYALTAMGDLVVEEFQDLLDTVETVQRLDDVVGLLPTEQMDFDVQRLGSATITTPETGDVLGHVRRGEELIAEAEHVRILTNTMMPAALEDLRDRVADADDGDLLVESVITGDAIERALSNPTLVDCIRDLLSSGRTPVYRYEGSIPMTLAVADETAILGPEDEQGIPGALIETDDEAVRAWVDEQFDAYREQSTELTVDDLPT